VSLSAANVGHRGKFVNTQLLLLCRDAALKIQNLFFLRGYRRSDKPPAAPLRGLLPCGSLMCDFKL